MKSGLLTSTSFFGKYLPNQINTHEGVDIVSTINLQQNYTH
jgi:hypothetical protein